jgi:hypothetical protein
MTVTCAALDTWREQVLCLLSRPTADPSSFDWWAQIWIPATVAAASLLVALASWLTARRATRIAKDSADAEATRSKQASTREEARDGRDYERSLDQALVALVEAAGSYAAAVDEWVDEASDVEINWRGHPDDTPYPPLPSTAVVYSKLQAAMIYAREGDRTQLGQVDGYIRDVFKSDKRYKASSRMKFLVETIRKWRDGSITAKTFHARVKRKRDTIAEDRDQVSRR